MSAPAQSNTRTPPRASAGEPWRTKGSRPGMASASPAGDAAALRAMRRYRTAHRRVTSHRAPLVMVTLVQSDEAEPTALARETRVAGLCTRTVTTPPASWDPLT